MVHRYLDPYIGMLKIDLKDVLYYKADFLLEMFFSIGYALLMIFVWTVLFESSGQSHIGGFTLQGIYAYFFLFAAFYAIADSNITYYIQNDVLEGTITAIMIRPVNYVMHLFIASVSNMLVGAATFSLPLLLIAVLIAHIPITAYGIALALLSLAVGFAVFGIISFLIGTLAIFVTRVYGLRYMVNILVYIVAGGTVPLSMFPQYLSNIVYALPFQDMGYLPVSIFLGTATPASISNGLFVGTVWAIVLGIFAFFWWKRVKKSITSVGG
jgi:ABC-2 type transport system permease protein